MLRIVILVLVLMLVAASVEAWESRADGKFDRRHITLTSPTLTDSLPLQQH